MPVIKDVFERTIGDNAHVYAADAAKLTFGSIDAAGGAVGIKDVPSNGAGLLHEIVAAVA